MLRGFPFFQQQAGYEIANSALFDSANSSHLSRTPGSAGNRKTWTVSTWVKLTDITNTQTLFSVGVGVNDRIQLLYVGSTNTLRAYWASAGVDAGVDGGVVLRDVAEWYHIVFWVDTTQATSSNRWGMYVNNVASTLTQTASAAYPPLNQDTHMNGTYVHRIGAFAYDATYRANNYFAETIIVDGQSLDATSFGEFDTNGRWIPKAYTGTYGTNGLYLDFSDATHFGKDSSGNGNDFTDSGFTTDHQVIDTPTNNYCTLNAIYPSAANISDGGLSSGTTAVRGTFNALLLDSYWEVTAGASAVTAGVISATGTTNTTSVTANKTFGFRLTTAGALDYKNLTDAGSWTSITTGLTGEQYPYSITASATWDFGQRGFTYTPPTGYKALRSQNLTVLPGPFNTYSSCSTEDDYSEGTYTGNGNADGPFVYLGYKPTYVCINGTAYTDGATLIDILSNGFKVRSTSSAVNTNSTSYTWEAWVDQDFKYGRAVANG